MKKTVWFVFKIEILIALLGFFVQFVSGVRAATTECLFPSCFPPCLPTCSPKPSPTGVVPTPTEIVPTPTEISPTLTPMQPTFIPTTQPTPTAPPAVGGPQEEVPSAGGPSGCGAQTPPAPHLKSVTTIKVGEVELIWDPVEPVTHYTISYGPSAGNYLYGVPNTGKVTSFRIGALGGGNYCFVVRAVNDCAPSSPSNELCTGGISEKVLGVKVLGATGGKDNLAWQILFIMGVVCGTLGAKRYFSREKEAYF